MMYESAWVAVSVPNLATMSLYLVTNLVTFLEFGDWHENMYRSLAPLRAGPSSVRESWTDKSSLDLLVSSVKKLIYLCLMSHSPPFLNLIVLFIKPILCDLFYIILSVCNIS